MTVTPAGVRRRYRLDTGARLIATTLIGGSPLKLFRLTPAGARAVEGLAAGETTAPSRLVHALLDAGAIHPRPERSPDGGIGYTAADVTVVLPTLGPPARVPPGAIVVDDGSQPPVADATLRLAVTSGPAAARNAGLTRVATPLVAFVDADVELPATWLEPLLPHFDDPRVGLVAPRVRSTPGPSALARWERDHSPLDLGAEPARIHPGTRVGYVPAAAIVCRADVVRALGGFDVDLRFGEDVDLVWRLAEAGWRCRYEPTAEVRHAPRASWPEWVRQRVGYGSSAGPLARRHPGALAPARVNGWSAAAWLLVALGRPVAGAAIGVGSSAALAVRLSDVPATIAFELAGRGTLRAGDQLATAVRRAWWPLLAVLAWRSRAARRALAAAVIAARSPLRLADDAAYSVGLWRGMVTARAIGPLVPDIKSWPGGGWRRLRAAAR